MPAPSLKFLKTFQVAARCGSFTAAAAELHVTPSAISHQVRGLEQQVGVALFRRTPRSLVLTESGARLYARIDPAFAALEALIRKDEGPHVDYSIPTHLVMRGSTRAI